MKEIPLPPRAAALSESLRDIGYSLETAIADIIDNSISAGASVVNIFFDMIDVRPYIGIVDNGCGMTEKELLEAMRHGARNPKKTRSKDDLGRFGLGLKTASFSQCTKLTVVSTKNGVTSGACWDIELVLNRDEWIVQSLDASEIQSLPYIDKLKGDGTLVLWDNLDRLQESGSEIINEKLLNEKMGEVEKHLSLVFHRFLSGEIRDRNKLSVSINYHQLQPFDPFCLGNKATRILYQEIIRHNDGDEMIIQPYILPHHSKLSAKERDYYQSRSDFLNNQGAYIYRNGRLMAWGDWFRLVPKSEATKLARVRIDFPSSLDEEWTIDIKKSKAYPPHYVREQLRKIIGRISDSAVKVHKVTGRVLYDSNPKPVWLRLSKQNTVDYSINRDHPILKGIIGQMDETLVRRINEALSLVESCIPVPLIYSDYSVNPDSFEQKQELSEVEILERLDAIYDILSADQS